MRLNTRCAEQTKDKIRATLLIQRLEQFVLGEKAPGTKRKVVLTATQVKAAMGLLDRKVPLLQRTEHTGADGGPIQHKRADELTDDELALIAAGRRTAPAEPAESTH